ncbi:IclR family transcriptional regulator [Bordetella trematum]|uniref:IclR family transcriptional regulator n=1 Tax=Bordetella trematum TaxID=123899 RepID=UPI003AF3470F
MEPSEFNSKSGVQTVNRAIQLLRLVAVRNKEGARLADIIRCSGLAKPTVYRLLGELTTHGLIMQGGGRRYHLGSFAYELGLAATAHFDLRELCQPSVKRLAEATGDTVFLTIRSGNDSFCLDRQSGSFPVKVFSLEIGHRQPLGVGAAGLALLSRMPEPEMEAVIRNNAHALGNYGGLDETRLLELARQARQNGYSLISDFAIAGVAGIGMAVVDTVGRPLLSLSVTTISSRMTSAHQNAARQALQKETTLLQGLLARSS